MPAANTRNFEVRAYEIDLHRRATLPTLINYMQEAAWHNAAARGGSVYLLHEHGVSWVLNRLRLEMFRYPRHLEQITVETWPSGRERFFVYRDYRLLDATGELIGQATSTWIVFDLAARKLVAVPEFLHDLVDLAVPANREPLPRSGGKIRFSEPPAYTQATRVRYHDLDINRHLNQAYYCQWAIEALPQQLIEEKTLKEIDILFKAECTLGDAITSQAYSPETGVFFHQLLRGDTPLTLARTVWT